MDARTVLGGTGAAQCYAVLFDEAGRDRPVLARAVRGAAMTGSRHDRPTPGGPTTDHEASGLAELRDWLSGRGLEVVLIILGSILLARFVAWIGGRITDRIDSRSTGGDVLVRSEAAKHRHSLTQVLTWAAIVLIYSIAVFFVLDRLGVPVTGLVAPATVLGVGLGFGAQRIVGDVLAGFFIITERQYGFGDVVSISVTGAGEPATGTVEDVTLRVTRMRSPNGEVITVPNGAIAKVVNLSRDWARAVVDVPIPTTVDVNRVNEILREVGREAFRDPGLRPLLLDPPSVMGVESLDLEQVNVRMVARTLPGKQFEVGRDLRARVVLAFREQGLTCRPRPPSRPSRPPTTSRGRVSDERAHPGAARGHPRGHDGAGRWPVVADPRTTSGARARRPSSSACCSWRSSRCT